MGPGSTGRYPISASGPFTSRYPANTFDPPPTLEELNKPRVWELDPKLGVACDDFTLFALDDLGRHDVSVQQYVRLHGRDMENGDYHLVVQLKKAPALTDFFFYVRYHTERYHPMRIEPGSVFGLEGDRLWLAELEVPGVVAAGMTRIRPDLNGGMKLDDGVVCEIVFAERPFDAKPHWIDRAPDKPRNQARNVTAYCDPQDGSLVLAWDETNVGDLNNDGEVGITDLIPVGRRYGRVSTDGFEDDWDLFPDANHDGEVNRRDTWLIEGNFGVLLSGYRVYRRPAGRPRAEEVLLKHNTFALLPLSIHRPTAWNPILVNQYRYHDRSVPGYGDYSYRIVPYNAPDDTEGEGSDVEVTVRYNASGAALARRDAQGRRK
jgi:hypothetical protein